MKKINILFVAILGLAFTLTVQADITSGLVAHYKFDSNTNDSSNNGNNATLNGSLTYVTGKNGQAIEIGSSDDYISVGNSIELNNNFSFSGWYKLSNTATVPSWNSFFHTRGAYCEAGGSGLGVMYQNESETIRIYDASNCYGIGSITYPIATNTWFQFSITYDGSTVNSYINTTLIDSFSYSGNLGNASASSDLPFIIGAMYIPSRNNLTYNWQGNIDDVRVYNRALSSSEIQQIYTGSSSCTSSEAGTVSTNLDIHVPSLNYETILGTQNIYADFKYEGKNSEGKHIWSLKDYGSN